MRAMIDTVSNEYLAVLSFIKLNMKAVAATTSIMPYWMIVIYDDAQNESGATSVKVRLHWSIFTAYFWKGKIAE